MAALTSLPTYGLAKIEVAPLLDDGGTGTAWATLGYTEENSCKLVEADPEITSHTPEELDTPIVEIFKAGKTSLAFSIIDPVPATLVTIKGGTTTGSTPNRVWNAPDLSASVDMSVKITPVSGYKVTISRVRMIAKINAEFSKKSLLKIDVTATVMPPNKSGVSVMIFTE